MLQACKASPMLMLHYISEPVGSTLPAPSSSAMFVFFAGVVLSKANCFTAPPGDPQEDISPFGIKNSGHRFKRKSFLLFVNIFLYSVPS